MDKTKILNVLLSKQFNEDIAQTVTGLQIILGGVMSIANAFMETDEDLSPRAVKSAKPRTIKENDHD